MVPSVVKEEERGAVKCCIMPNVAIVCPEGRLHATDTSILATSGAHTRLAMPETHLYAPRRLIVNR